MDGEGQLGAAVSFSFIAKANPLNGALQYQDNSMALKVHSSNGIDSLSFSGNCATFTGNAKVNEQTGYRFSVNACDNHDAGAGADTFSIDVTNGSGFSYHKDGALTQGAIRRR